MSLNRIDADDFRLNDGQFDADYRYLRQTSSGARTTMLAGPGFAVSLNTSAWDISWRFKCGGYNISGDADAGSPPSNVSNTPSSVAL